MAFQPAAVKDQKPFILETAVKDQRAGPVRWNENNFIRIFRLFKMNAVGQISQQIGSGKPLGHRLAFGQSVLNERVDALFFFPEKNLVVGLQRLQIQFA